MTSEPVRLFFQSLPFRDAEGPPLRIPPRTLMGLQTLKERLEVALELGDGHRHAPRYSATLAISTCAVGSRTKKGAAARQSSEPHDVPPCAPLRHERGDRP